MVGEGHEAVDVHDFRMRPVQKHMLFDVGEQRSVLECSPYECNMGF
jgi:hypothetical protein